MKTVKIGEFIHLVTYSCGENTLCNKKIPIGASFVERMNMWEATCPRCKVIIAGPKPYRSHQNN